MDLDTGRFRIKDYESYFGRTRGVGALEVNERKDDYQTNFNRGMFTEPRPTLQITFFVRYARTKNAPPECIFINECIQGVQEKLCLSPIHVNCRRVNT